MVPSLPFREFVTHNETRQPGHTPRSWPSHLVPLSRPRALLALTFGLHVHTLRFLLTGVV